jgi:2-polyprenyl-6-hydroxyphenyl methylase/3-demethylubiquinone-9 3-methyltransferase
MIDSTDRHAAELRAGERFAFGDNWRRFLDDLTPARIEAAEASLRDMLGVSTLAGRTFLDVGSGSGLFSLAARRLGATVRSFDYDPASVACTRELRRRYCGGDPDWIVERGSILDETYTAALGTFNVVYAWGSLHHTGEMWRAIERTTALVGTRGRLFLAIYNDQGALSSAWRVVKRVYCSGTAGRIVVTAGAVPVFWMREQVARLAGRRKDTVRLRGMSPYRDWIDWLGGYPFEVASVDALVRFQAARGLVAERTVTTRRLGCNQIVFVRTSA